MAYGDPIALVEAPGIYDFDPNGDGELLATRGDPRPGDLVRQRWSPGAGDAVADRLRGRSAGRLTVSAGEIRLGERNPPAVTGHVHRVEGEPDGRARR